ncbi:MAG: hypothetical protein HY043_08125 [Verrucomicrobia bacterium]|nr:hypothetical protein [Verrucomicrobiota bacterium]
MKTDQPHGDNAPLDALLKEWNPKPSLPPRFQEQVWRRIERVEAMPAPSVSLATAFANWMAIMLPRPALATAYVAVLLVIGASVGWSQARQETARVTSDLSTRYVQAIDPYHANP